MPTQLGMDRTSISTSVQNTVQIGHYVIFAGKFFNKVLRKGKLNLGEGWMPQLKLIFSSSYSQSYGKFINKYWILKPVFSCLSAVLFVHLCNENNSNEFREVQCYEYIVTQTRWKHKYLCEIVFQSQLNSEVWEDGTYTTVSCTHPSPSHMHPNNEWVNEWMNE